MVASSKTGNFLPFFHGANETINVRDRVPGFRNSDDMGDIKKPLNMFAVLAAASF